jgi:hypothetical protein
MNVIGANNRATVKGNYIGKLKKRFLDFGNARIIIQMFAVDVCDDGNGG